jgi:GDP-L-fucose synthase
MPTNLYGPNDSFDLERSHVLPAMIRKIHLADCLKRGDWESLRTDLRQRPVENVDGTTATNEAIVLLLKKYGITPAQLELWGTGKPLREFLWSEDMANACVYVMEHINFEDLKGTDKEIRNCHINIGTGKEITIKDLAALIVKTVGYEGRIVFNNDKPDGTMRKLTDPSKLHALGWHHTIEIEEGIERIYKWYKETKK